MQEKSMGHICPIERSGVKIAMYCGVKGRGGGAPKSYKNNSIPHLCH